MLKQCTGYAITVNTCFYHGTGVNCMLGPKSNGGCIVGEAMNNFSSDNCNRVHRVKVRGIQAVSLVVPTMKYQKVSTIIPITNSVLMMKQHLNQQLSIELQSHGFVVSTTINLALYKI